MYGFIDTLEITKKLKKQGGFDDNAAETLAEIFKVRDQESSQNLATKDDLAHLEERLRKDFKIAVQTILIGIGAMIVAAVGVITWLDKIIS